MRREGLSTDLHRACAMPLVSVEELRRLLGADEAAAGAIDSTGKLPLHIISANEQLQSRCGIELKSFIINEMISANPRGPTSTDNDGNIPFVAVIKDWIEQQYDCEETTTLTITTSPRFLSRHIDSISHSAVGGSTDVFIPEGVSISPMVSWSIGMLSSIVMHQKQCSNPIIEHVASTRGFLKTLLLIEDERERNEIFGTVLVRGTLQCAASISPWLTDMLKSRSKRANESAVWYLELISSVRDDDVGVFKFDRSNRAMNTQEYFSQHSNRPRLFSKVSTLPGILPAIMHLEKSNFERTCTTGVLQYIFDKELFRPQTLFVIVLDFLFLSFLIASFILSSNAFFAPPAVGSGVPPVRAFVPNETIYKLCNNGTIGYFNNFLDSDPQCRYYFVRLLDDPHYYAYPCETIDCAVCVNYDYLKDGLVEAETTDEGLPANEADYVHYCLSVTAQGRVIKKNYAKRRMTVRNGLITTCCSSFYFLLRHLSAWFTVPYRLLIAKFGASSLIDIASVCMAVILQSIFMNKVNKSLIRRVHEAEMISPDLFDEFAFLIEGLTSDESFDTLKACAAVTVGLLFMKALVYFKVINKYLATFVFALGEIMKDIFWFLWIVLLMIVASAQMFHTITSHKEVCQEYEDDLVPSNPFCKISTSFLSSYLIILGDFDIDDFTTSFSLFLFVAYSFTVIIVVLNFLIAIISDSYDKSMTRIDRHFGRARFMFVVEVDAFLDVFKSGPRFDTSLDNQATADRRCRLWITFRRCMWGGSWMKCSLTIAFLSMGYLAVYTAALRVFVPLDKGADFHGERRLAMKVVIALVIFFLSVMVAGGFSQEGTCFVVVGNALAANKFSKRVGSYLGKVIISVFRLILGGSHHITTDDTDEGEWCGRLLHMEQRVTQSAVDFGNRIHESMEQTAQQVANNTSVQMKVLQRSFQSIEVTSEARNVELLRDLSQIMDSRFAQLKVELVAELSHKTMELEKRVDSFEDAMKDDIRAIMQSIDTLLEERRLEKKPDS